MRIDVALGNDPLLAPLVARHPGLRVPGIVDGHELAIRAVLGQQISVAAARGAAARLAAEFGRALPAPVGSLTHAFPSAPTLAAADPTRIALPAQRRTALLNVSRAIADGTIDLGPGSDREVATQRLLAVPGIGEWTTAYIAMRALRDPDAFPAGDLGLRRALERLGEPGDPRSARGLAERWRPWRAYALLQLWQSLADDPMDHRPSEPNRKSGDVRTHR
jgi:AraC family transcriptional regulator of adaptative response / DNA-3-methyladenine glycosylase II